MELLFFKNDTIYIYILSTSVITVMPNYMYQLSVIFSYLMTLIYYLAIYTRKGKLLLSCTCANYL
jgi:hypothetical protein